MSPQRGRDAGRSRASRRNLPITFVTGINADSAVNKSKSNSNPGLLGNSHLPLRLPGGAGGVCQVGPLLPRRATEGRGRAQVYFQVHFEPQGGAVQHTLAALASLICGECWCFTRTFDPDTAETFCPTDLPPSGPKRSIREGEGSRVERAAPTNLPRTDKF